VRAAIANQDILIHRTHLLPSHRFQIRAINLRQPCAGGHRRHRRDTAFVRTTANWHQKTFRAHTKAAVNRAHSRRSAQFTIVLVLVLAPGAYRSHFLIAARAKSRFHPAAMPAPHSKFKRFLIYWLPLLVWMCIIFTASSDTQSAHHSSLIFEPIMRWLFPHMTEEHIGQFHHLFRKCCHLTEYSLLALLAWRAIRQPQKGDRRPWRWDEAGLALTIVFAYAATDEFHQIFVPGRTALVSDVMVDTSGGVLGLTLLWFAGKITKRW